MFHGTLNPLFEFNMYVDVSMVQNNPIIRALEDGMRNLESWQCGNKTFCWMA
jgi:hypothetical protein